MPKRLDELRERLLRAGVAPRYVRRYLSELADHLEDLRAEEKHLGRSREEAEASALRRLGGADQLARAMIDQARYQSWLARAPWAILGLCPLLALAGGYLIALFILWSGWKIFLPGADTPFGGHHMHGFANLYFQAGKALYYGAPIFVGWGIGLLAERQRVKAAWPAASLALIAWVGAAARVQAGRAAIPDGIGHIRVDLVFGSSALGVFDVVVHASVIFLATALPYFIWRLRRHRLLSA